MKVLSYDDFTKNIESVLDRTVETNQPVAISRGNGKDVVILPLGDYNSWMETMYLSRSANNSAKLLESVKRTEKGDFFSRALIEE